MAGSSSSIRPANGRTKFPVSGPHFGKALDTVIKDRLDVALWFLKDRERCAAHPDIANYLVAATKSRLSASKTPRHNRAQLDFLDGRFLDTVLNIVTEEEGWPINWLTHGKNVRAVPESMFGWDLYVGANCLHCGEPNCTGDREFCGGKGVSFAIEIKPIISDRRTVKGEVIEDPAAILRQAVRQRNTAQADSYILYAEEIDCVATLAELEDYFSRSGVTLVTLDDVGTHMMSSGNFVDLFGDDASSMISAYGYIKRALTNADDLIISWHGANQFAFNIESARKRFNEQIPDFVRRIPYALIHHALKESVDGIGIESRWLIGSESGYGTVYLSFAQASRIIFNMLRGIV
ncbi:hypothetical protein WJ542_11335 [Paraburkholderia sp. B3]|uniref:hypothetical protein n=1 Tax=Paraburkholderia sp. B3 TaxID=3134791 RepID=UPI0039820F6D